MDWGDIIAIAISAGGVLTILVQGLMTRKVTQANAIDKLSSVYERRLEALCKRAENLEIRVDEVEMESDTQKTEILNLRGELQGRESMIKTLQQENQTLKSQVKKLIKENVCKDLRIEDLTNKIRELEDRLNRYAKASDIDQIGE